MNRVATLIAMVVLTMGCDKAIVEQTTCDCDKAIPPASAGDCSAVLQQDHTQIESKQQMYEELEKYHSEATRSDSKEKSSFSGAVGIYLPGMAIVPEFNHSKSSDIEQERNVVDQLHHVLSSSAENKFYMARTSPEAIAAWSNCVKGGGRGTVLEAEELPGTGRYREVDIQIRLGPNYRSTNITSAEVYDPTMKALQPIALTDSALTPSSSVSLGRLKRDRHDLFYVRVKADCYPVMQYLLLPVDTNYYGRWVTSNKSAIQGETITYPVQLSGGEAALPANSMVSLQGELVIRINGEGGGGGAVVTTQVNLISQDDDGKNMGDQWLVPPTANYVRGSGYLRLPVSHQFMTSSSGKLNMSLRVQLWNNETSPSSTWSIDPETDLRFYRR